ncbi:MAG: hypothetical protein HWE21_16500 [Cytophagia bacterium]|nr:hypothetical protein [Cytophagia bacterium]
MEIDQEYILILGTIGMLMLTIGIIVFILLYQRKLMKKNLAFQRIEEMLKKQELDSAYAMLEGQEVERKRLAAEVHDNLGSILVTLNMYADTALKVEDSEKRAQMISKISEYAGKATEETRNLAHRLDAAELRHFGLERAIRGLLDAIRDNYDFQIGFTFNIEGEVIGEVALNIYRMIQEMVNNTLKHANASRIELTVSEVDKGQLSIIYEDNGSGFEPEKLRKGMGLNNITSRVRKMDGEIGFKKELNSMCTTIEIPIG